MALEGILLEARGFPRVLFLRMSTNPLLAVTPVLMNLCLAVGRWLYITIVFETL